MSGLKKLNIASALSDFLNKKVNLLFHQVKQKP